jgi:Domain of unknown function (DUF4123)
MKPSGTTLAPDPQVLQQEVLPHLFPAEGEINTFVVLDGASVPDLLDQLYADPAPEFVCLYRGELEPDIAEIAPYLVRLEPHTAFTDWVLTEGWSRHWGIFALSRSGLKAVRTHFRKFLMVKDPEGKQLYFRFYDPRVLRIFLPTCARGELEMLFGPIARFFCEGDQPATALLYTLEALSLNTRKIPFR